VERVRLLDILRQYFNESELKDLCFSLAVDYEALPGASVWDKARELVTYAERHLGVVELVDHIVKLRPNAFWRDRLRTLTIESTQATQEIPAMAIYATQTGRLNSIGQAELARAVINIQDRLVVIEQGMMIGRMLLTVLSAVVACLIIVLLIVALHIS
jgi:hypothetical protein